MFSTFFLSQFCHSLCISSKKKQAREESEGGISQKFDDRKKTSSGALEIGRKKKLFNAITFGSSIGDSKKNKTGPFSKPF